MTEQHSELARITLSVLFIGGLIAGSLWILSPFLAAFIWATMIVVATWPMMRRVEHALGGRRAAAVAVMTIGLLAILIVPLAVALEAILTHADDLAALLKRLPTAQLPAAPEWLGRLPLVGERVQEAWNQRASEGISDLTAQAQPYARAAAEWFAHQAGSFALVLVQFLLIVILCARCSIQAASPGPRGCGGSDGDWPTSRATAWWCSPARRSAAWRSAWS